MVGSADQWQGFSPSHEDSEKHKNPEKNSGEPTPPRNIEFIFASIKDSLRLVLKNQFYSEYQLFLSYHPLSENHV